MDLIEVHQVPVVAIEQTRANTGAPAATHVAKQMKADTSLARSKVNYLLLIKWIQPDFQPDVWKENPVNGDVKGCCNTYICLVMLVQGDLTSDERPVMIQVAFQLSKKESKKAEGSVVGNLGKHFGIRIGQPIKGYYNNLLPRIRVNFESFLKMFLNDSESMTFIAPHLSVFEIRNRLPAHKIAKVCGNTTTNTTANAPVATVRSVQSNVSIINAELWQDLVPKGKMNSVRDVRYPITNVVDKEFVVKNQEWGNRMMW